MCISQSLFAFFFCTSFISMICYSPTIHRKREAWIAYSILCSSLMCCFYAWLLRNVRRPLLEFIWLTLRTIDPDEECLIIGFRWMRNQTRTTYWWINGCWRAQKQVSWAVMFRKPLRCRCPLCWRNSTRYCYIRITWRAYRF